MRIFKGNWALLSALAILLAAGLWWFSSPPSPRRPGPSTPALPDQLSPALQSTTPPASLPAALTSAAEALTRSSHADAPSLLRGIELLLRSGKLAEASEAIERFLDGKADAPTRLGFRLNAHGLLDEAPTLRTWLLDQWAQMDPAAAARYTKTILDTSDSPDEWALAMRNLARTEDLAATREFLGLKFSEMLGRESWRENPSVGFLEAFDVPVFLGGTNLVPALSACVRDHANPAIAHAGFLALDRLVIREPESILAALLNDPAHMTGREQTRANYFARADLTQPAQRQILERYLLEPSRSPAELRAFAGVFPNANFMLSHNLLTPPVSMTHDELVRRDRVALLVLKEWSADPRFNHVRAQLVRSQERLQDFVDQADRGR